MRRQAATFVRNEVASVREEDESIVVESALQKLFNDLGTSFRGTPRWLHSYLEDRTKTRRCSTNGSYRIC